MYRDRDLSNIAADIRQTEDIIINQLNVNDSYYVYLTASAEFLLKHDDGESLSNNKQELINTEIEYFDTLFDNVMLGNVIKINVENKAGNYNTDKNILNKLTKLIESENYECK